LRAIVTKLTDRRPHGFLGWRRLWR
jgi:hypothetical protein